LVQVAAGRVTPAENIHLTLEFLGEIGEERLGLLHDVAAAVRGRRFKLSMDRVGSFRRARVAWAGCESPAPQAMELQADLSRRLRAEGFDLEERPFAPHVTLARKTQASVLRARIEPIEWRVKEFALVSSNAGRYTTLASWRLR
jgi:RNA 2',3'-cyclic 3'-phosphodiesterase